MSNHVEGGYATRDTNYERYGRDFYRRIGAMGGRVSRGGGFASEKVGKDGLTGKERAKIAGYKGGRISRRGVAE